MPRWCPVCDKRICAKLIDKASHRYCNTCAIIKNLAVNFVSCPETRQNRWGSNNQARKLNTDLRLGAAPNAPYPYMKRGHPDNVKEFLAQDEIKALIKAHKDGTPANEIADGLIEYCGLVDMNSVDPERSASVAENFIWCLRLLHEHGGEALIDLYAVDVEHGRGDSLESREIRRGGTIWDLALWFVNREGRLQRYAYWTAGRNGMFSARQRREITAALLACGASARILHWGGCEEHMLRSAGVPEGVAIDGLQVIRFMTGGGKQGRYRHLEGRMCTGLPALSLLFGINYVHGADTDTPQTLQIFTLMVQAGARALDEQLEGGYTSLFR